MADPMQLVSMRMPADLWSAAQRVTEREGTTVSELVRTYLADYVRENDKQGDKSPVPAGTTTPSQRVTGQVPRTRLAQRRARSNDRN